MSLDLLQFYRACNPSKPIDMSASEREKYYIDFSAVRSRNIIDELQANITLFSPNTATCQLFAGHIGCGKSTELLYLKSILEDAGFYVVYFEASQLLDLADVDIGEILLAIATYLSQHFPPAIAPEATGIWQSLLREIWKVFNREFQLGSMPHSVQIATETLQKENQHPSLSSELRTISTYAKHSPELRWKLRQYLEPRLNLILQAINTEVIEPAMIDLQQQGYKGLVTIVDNLDRLEAIEKPWGRLQTEYLFVDRAEQLCKLNCHMVYAIPLTLIFSKEFGRLVQRFGSDPKVLPAIPVRDRRGQIFPPGIDLLQQMVLARAFPDVARERRLERLPQVFDNAQTLERLCYISGGHPRNLLRLLHRWIEKERQLPLSRNVLEVAIRERCHQLLLSLSEPEKDLLRRVADRQRISPTENSQLLLHNLFVFEYQDEDGSWFDLNPILLEAPEFAR
ncbi:MAG TPA: ATP-binding protein [Oscillatoriales cyanobacterium M59_W2019_021]|nr:ATP-binding protein [Oscillatoriales cyanobacterium M4454_W2019_049]HIK49743.1 ATP-binding protein [Oscillatoriales cyanobacterium M59_W2019_021]